MKKVFFCFAVAATCLPVACALKEAPVTEASDSVMVYYIQAHGGENTKSEIDNSTAAFTWSAGDQIAVYTGGGYKKSLALDAGGSASATFAFSEDIDANRADFAIFPANLVFNGSSVRSSSAGAHSASGLTVTLPSEYNLSEIQDSKSPVPMIAANAPGDGLAFKQLGALLRLQLKNLPKQTEIITLDFNGKKVQGEFTLTGVTPGTTALATEAAAAGNDVVTVNNDVFSSFQEAVIVNIPVPAGTYTDVTVTTWDADNNVINAITTPIKADADWTAARKSTRKQIATLPVFTADGEKKVVFAPGNLQAVLDEAVFTKEGTGSTAGTQFWSASAWSFAANQYTAIGNTAANTLSSPATDDVVDLFSWIGASATSKLGYVEGWKYGILKIVSTSGTSSFTGDAKGEDLLFDWGGCEIDAYPAGTWRMPSQTDWEAILTRTEPRRSLTRFVRANLTISDSPLTTVKGVIVIPDEYTHPLATAFTSVNSSSSNFDSNTISSLADWAKLEKAGCVFLPVTGQRTYSSGNVVTDETTLWYWSSTSNSGNTQGFAVQIKDGGVSVKKQAGRYTGCAVRLIRDVN